MHKKITTLLLGVLLMGSTPYDSLPTALPSICAWWDFTNNSTITQSGGKASVVTDLTGNGNTLTQPTGANQPGVSTVSGYQGLTFSGTNNQLIATSSTTTFTAGTNPLTFFVVFNPNTQATNAFMFSSGNTASANQSVIMVSTANVLSVNSFGATVSTGTAVGGVNQVMDRAVGTSLQGSLNGASVSSGTITLNNTAGFPLVVGNNDSGTAPFNGTVYEVIVYNTALSTAQYQMVQGYAACKYGIQSLLPSTHPYRSICPFYPNPMFMGG